MATPLTFLTSQRIIRMAYEEAGLVPSGQDLTSDQYANGLLRLNDMAYLWQTQGLKLWTVTELPITLVSGRRLYQMGPGYTVDMTKPLRVLQAVYVDSSNIRRPLVVMSKEEYTRLSQQTQQGAVNSYYVDKQQYTLDLYLWPVPDTSAVTGTVRIILQQQVVTPASLTADTGFPPEWAIALRWGLADELATGQPQSIMDRCEKRAKAYREALEDWDVEDAATYFTPDQRSVYYSTSFR